MHYILKEAGCIVHSDDEIVSIFFSVIEEETLGDVSLQPSTSLSLLRLRRKESCPYRVFLLS